MSSNIIFNEYFTNKILKIELNNLSKKNALSLEMLSEMTLKLSQNNYIKKFKCVVITGAKKSAFSSGADLAAAASFVSGFVELRVWTTNTLPCV